MTLCAASDALPRGISSHYWACTRLSRISGHTHHHRQHTHTNEHRMLLLCLIPRRRRVRCALARCRGTMTLTPTVPNKVCHAAQYGNNTHATRQPHSCSARRGTTSPLCVWPPPRLGTTRARENASHGHVACLSARRLLTALTCRFSSSRAAVCHCPVGAPSAAASAAQQLVPTPAHGV